MKHFSSLRTAFHWIVAVSTIGLIWFIVTAYWQINQQKQFIDSDASVDFPDRAVLIYAATPFFNEPITTSSLKKCPADVKSSCYITNNPKSFSKAKSVLFHSRDFDEKKMTEFSKKFDRKPEVPYVMWILESPFFAHLHPYEHFFNWTMSYRTVSDVHFPYGGLVRSGKKQVVDYDEIWDSKPKSALWLVSNNYKVGNKRKELVEKMVENGLRVDLLGKLYKEPPGCPHRAADECDLKLHKPYKFTIAFENNNCEEYVTEKFWRKMIRFEMVPIVMDRRFYRGLGVPDSMYLAVSDFPSLKEFVAHVDRVSSNKTAYLEYHKWRENFRIVDTSEDDFGFCKLCRMLRKFNGKPVTSYSSLTKWHDASTCDNSFADRYL